MELKVKMKPVKTIITGPGTDFNTVKRRNSLYPNTYGTYGKYRSNLKDKCAYVYTAQIYKRHRELKDRAIVVKVYRIPESILDVLGVGVIQESRTFRFIPNGKNTQGIFPAVRIAE